MLNTANQVFKTAFTSICKLLKCGRKGHNKGGEKGSKQKNRKWNKMETLELISTICEIKYTLDHFNRD